MRKDSPAWHAEARFFYNAGHPISKIAAHFGKTYNAVQYAVNHNNEREKHAERVRRQTRPWTPKDALV